MTAWIGGLSYLLGLMGYTGSLRRLGVSPYLRWITAMLLQILILYGFAMLGQLRLGIYLITGVGIGLWVLWQILGLFHRGSLPFEGLHLFDFWMVALGWAMADVLGHSPLVHYDNFSHWAVMVKFMVFTGHLPGAGDQLISFTSYPPATALFITQFVTWTGFSEGAMLVAQFGLIWAAAYAVFAVLRDRTRALTAMILCLTIAGSFVFNIAIRLNNLLVDYVLPILAVAALAGIFAYHTRPWLLCGHVAVFVAALLLVKNSATFFVVVIAGYFLVTLLKTGRTGWSVPGNLLRAVGTLALGSLPFLIWQWHVHTTFPVSKHEISAQAYHQQLAEEGTTGLLKIARKFGEQLLNPQSLSTQGILLINGLLIGTWLALRLIKGRRNGLLKTAIGVDLMFGLYDVSLLGMYGLSMPYAEAILLDGFERYRGSVVILGLFIGAMVLVRELDAAFYEQNFEKRDSRSFATIMSKNAYQLSTLVAGFFAITMMYSEITGTNFTNRMAHNTLPLQLRRCSQPWTRLNHRKVLVVDPHAVDVNDYYAGYAARYYYFTDKAVCQEDFMVTPAVFKQTVQAYDYVVIPEFHRTFTVLTQKVYHQHVITGLYRVTPQRLIREH
ncbi:ABC transporter permease [Levilactobacillus zymae]|nr:ABC transporter permease [Levilactobacillus zymae]